MGEPIVTVVPLADKKVSVRVYGTEVFLLPERRDCNLADLDRAFNAVATALDGGDWV